jgi:hypothetical protein
MSIRRFCLVATVVGACQGNEPSSADKTAPGAAGTGAIEVIVGGKVTARVMPGHPCRATVDGVELLVGGPPLVAQVGDTKWTADTRENGTTLMSNERPAARILANQLFDATGIPLIKVEDDGKIVNVQRVVRQATAEHEPAERVVIRGIEKWKNEPDVVVTNTDDVALAGLLAAPEADPTLRGLAACYLLQSSKP